MGRKELPTIFLIPGAFQSPDCYSRLVPLLKQAGYPVVVGSLVSLDPKDPEKCTSAEDGGYLLHHYLLPLIDAGKEVIIYAHSYGATCMSGADRHLTKLERSSAGQPGGVLGLLYMSFITVRDGIAPFIAFNGSYPDFIKTDCPRAGLLTIDPIIDTLFNDAESKQAVEFSKVAAPHSMNAIQSPVSAPIWADPALEGRRIAIRTMLDMTFLPPLQDLFIKNSGVKWDVIDVNAGHEAFLTQPDAIARIICNAATAWA